MGPLLVHEAGCPGDGALRPACGQAKWHGRRGSPTSQRGSGLRVVAPTCRTSNGLCEQCFGTQEQEDALRNRI
jgi:hypothetical protein